jgi:hypothetical protein
MTPLPFVVSLSNHGRRAELSFDRLRTNGARLRTNGVKFQRPPQQHRGERFALAAKPIY